MKRLFVFSLLMLAVVTATAQSVLTGTIKNSQGARVEFVSIGVEGDSIGTVSDGNGHYSLTIPAGAKGTLKFSHISYAPYTIALQEVLGKKQMDVTLKGCVQDLADVNIVYGKKTKTISSKGIKGPGTLKISGTKCCFEAGPVVKVGSDYAISHLILPVRSTTYSACTLAIEVYEVVGDKFNIVMRKPIYRTLKKGGSQRLDIIPEEGIILKKGHRYYVGVRLVEVKSDGHIEFPAYFKSGYARNFVMGKRKKIPATLGMEVKGVKVERE